MVNDRKKNELIIQIIDMEFSMFERVHNEGGRADCQDNRPMFETMRASQFLTWDEDTLKSYMKDLEEAENTGRNLLAEKYAFMMQDTDPEGFAKIKDAVKTPGKDALMLIHEIMEIYMRQTEDFMGRYPQFLKKSRPVYTKDSGRVTSIETYMRGELMTYSEKTLGLLLLHMKDMEGEGLSMVYEIYRHTAKAYGFDSVKEAADNQHEGT